MRFMSSQVCFSFRFFDVNKCQNILSFRWDSLQMMGISLLQSQLRLFVCLSVCLSARSTVRPSVYLLMDKGFFPGLHMCGMCCWAAMSQCYPSGSVSLLDVDYFICCFKLIYELFWNEEDVEEVEGIPGGHNCYSQSRSGFKCLLDLWTSGI